MKVAWRDTTPSPPPKDLLGDLNPEQRAIVEKTDGHVLVLAGAGAGKTRVLTYKVAYLLDQSLAQPHNILAVTFTNKAAQEMKDRIKNLVGIKDSHWWIGTFHGICVRILVRYGKEIGIPSFFTIADEKEQQKELKAILETHTDSNLEVEQLQGTISWAKNNLVRPADLMVENRWEINPLIGQMYGEYQDRLQKMNTLDFDDLIMRTIDLFNLVPTVRDIFQEQFKYVCCDESQDLNIAQMEFLKLVSGKHHNLMLIGDIDQNIYSWRGASLDVVLAFSKMPETAVMKLEQNYRSSKTIVDASNELVKKNKNRIDKTLWTNNESGEIITYHRADTEYEEAKFVSHIINYFCSIKRSRKYGDFAILYRTNGQSRVLEDQLSAMSIRYQIIGGVSFYDRKEVKDIVAYLRMLVNPNDVLSFQRVANEPKRGVGAVAIKSIVDFAHDKDLSISDTLDRVDEIKKVSTKAKEALKQMNTVIKEFRKAVDKVPPPRLIRDYVVAIGYLQMLEQDEDRDRISNVYEVSNIAAEWLKARESDQSTKLEEFIRQISLVSEPDTLLDNDNSVKLMTVHIAKGLEYPVVFMVGMEENLFPHFMAINSEARDVEEERRLCYVCMTRAKEKLYIVNAEERRSFGRCISNPPSRFIGEIPNHLVKRV